MKELLRVLKSEFRRIISDRKLVICTLCVLAAFIAVISIFLATNNFGISNYTPRIEECREQFDYYQRFYLFLSGETQEPPGLYYDTSMTVERAKEQMEYFAFMVKNNGEIYRFIDLSRYYGQTNPNPYDIPPFSLGAQAQVWIMLNSFYVLTLIAVLLSVLICLSPYTSGVMKNYYAAPVKKSTLFVGKLTVCLALCLLLWFVVFIWGLCFGAVGEPIRVLHFNGNEYTSYNLYGVFATKMLGTLLAMLFTSALTVLIGRLTNRNFISAFVVIAVLVVVAICFEVKVTQSYMTGAVKCLLPIIGLRANHYVAADWGLWVLYGVYTILTAVLFAASVFIRRKESIKN